MYNGNEARILLGVWFCVIDEPFEQSMHYESNNNVIYLTYVKEPMSKILNDSNSLYNF